MPVRLEKYPNCASNLPDKFHRSIKSFKNQLYDNNELIIIGDNCNLALNEFYKEEVCFNIHFIMGKTPSQSLYSGYVRNLGIELSIGEIICYLDCDDILLPEHLKIISENFNDNDWIYWNDLICLDKTLGNYKERINIPKEGRIGTSSIAHKRELKVYWKDGYGHDWKFVEDLLGNDLEFEKCPTPGYLVCHIPNDNPILVLDF